MLQASPPRRPLVTHNGHAIQQKGDEHMLTKNIIRAWKDPSYRNGLSEGERAALPAHPAGLIELADADLDAAGGRPKLTRWWECCTPNYSWFVE
jgi:mersacidin/lichenicidin family type 2 lantibiotic